MYLVHKSTIKNTDGVIDIDLLVVDGMKINSYTYHLSSDWAAEKFHKLYRKSRSTHGKALAVLNKFKIRQEDKK
jgi:hypothetical protein